MACTLHAEGFPASTTEKELRELFGIFGPVHAIHLAITAEGESIGFAKIEMVERTDAMKAMEALHHTYVGGRLLLVFDGTPRTKKT